MASDHSPDDVIADRVAAGAAQRARLRVRGDLDGRTAQRLVAAVAESLAAPTVTRVELDLAAVTFVDAAGVRCLLMCRQAARNAGIAMVLRDPAPTVVRVLKATGVLARFDIAGARHDGTTAAQMPPKGHGDPDEWQEWSRRIRREASQTRMRARAAVERSRAIRRGDI